LKTVYNFYFRKVTISKDYSLCFKFFWIPISRVKNRPTLLIFLFNY